MKQLIICDSILCVSVIDGQATPPLNQIKPESITVKSEELLTLVKQAPVRTSYTFLSKLQLVFKLQLRCHDYRVRQIYVYIHL